MKTYTRHTVTHDDLELEIPFVDPYGMDIEDNMLFGRTPEGKIIVSYLLHDADSSHMDPSKEECWGWDPWVVLGSQRDADALGEMLNACAECGEYADTHTLEFFEPDDLHEFVNSHRSAMRAGRAFYFEKYEHGNVIYALRGESSQVDRQWDVTSIAGFMEASGEWTEGEWGANADYEQAARDSLDEYTNWCNGWVYGIVHCFYEPDGTFIRDESCWGFIGAEYAERELKDEHEGCLT